MNIYISGPITGRTPEEVQAAFGTAAEMMRAEGFTAINPADISGWGLSWTTYMHIAREILISGEIDAVYMLEGWEGSRGAKLEREWALSMGKPVYHEEKAKRRGTAARYYERERRAQVLKDRAERPYDAMGDDQGRGGTADDWYRENFVEKYDDGKKEGNGIPREVAR